MPKNAPLDTDIGNIVGTISRLFSQIPSDTCRSLYGAFLKSHFCSTKRKLLICFVFHQTTVLIYYGCFFFWSSIRRNSLPGVGVLTKLSQSANISLGPKYGHTQPEIVKADRIYDNRGDLIHEQSYHKLVS